MRYSKSWTQALEEVQEQTGVRKVDFVDGITPDIVEEKCPDCGKDPCECKKEATQVDETGYEKQKKGDKLNVGGSGNLGASLSGPAGKGDFMILKKAYKPGQDQFQMIVIDDKGFITKDWGSHPSLDGAKKFAKNRGYKEEVEINEADYELYHKDFSSAMQHAYKHAKKQGFTVDPQEIDDKVATGPKKPSKGKTNRYILGTDKKKKVHIQVANLDNKKFELNMYIEETQPKKEDMDLDQTIRQVVEGKVKKEDSDKSEPGTQGDDAEYAKKRDAVLKKYGVKACGECESEEEKKACFKDLDDAHVADHEEEVKKEDKEYGPSTTDAGKASKAKGKVDKDKRPLAKYEETDSPLYSHIRKLLRNK